jgi:hypothetical protein
LGEQGIRAHEFVDWESEGIRANEFARSENEVRLRALHGVENLVG